MNIFNRLFKIGQAEAHTLVDKLEDPIKLTEQGIRDMKADLDKAMQALAEVKAMAIRAKREIEQFQAQVGEYEAKAVQLLKKAEAGQIDIAEADRLATLSLQRQTESQGHLTRAQGDKEKFEKSAAQLDVNISKMRVQINTWENELKTLRARAKVSAATKNINRQLAQIDSGGTVAMLERMKEKVDADEALAESYGEMANKAKSVDEEIDKALADASPAAENLAALKAKLGMNKPPESV
ncbi:MAG TPA: phage shock protein A [Bacteroidales bacterium]|nr:phage shock protein A [Bacteroidales bacterium]